MMFRKDWMKSLTGLTALIVAILGVASAPLTAAAASDVPPAVVTAQTTVSATGLPGDDANVALDACGNIYTLNQGSGQVVEVPNGGGAATTVLAASSYGTASLAIDDAKANLYVLQGFTGSVYQIPIANCVPQPSSKVSIGIGNLGAVSYYWQGSALATDAGSLATGAGSAADLFIGVSGACCSSPNQLVEEYPAGGFKYGVTLLSSLAYPINSIALDSNSNIFYVSGCTSNSSNDQQGTCTGSQIGAVYELPVTTAATSSTPALYSSTPVAFGSGYSTNVVGVSFDPAGNMYIADAGNSKIYEIPYETNGTTSALNPSDQFVVASGINITSAVAFDASGNLYYTYIDAAGTSNSVYLLTRGNANLGQVAVGKTAAASLNVYFNSALTPASIGFVTPKGVYSAGSAATGACTAGKAYAQGDTCTINVSFAPSTPGISAGALVLRDSTQAALSTTALFGTGLGAGFTTDPGTPNSVGSGLTTPTSVALDAVGDVFIADSGANAVWEFTPGSTKPASLGTGLKAPTGVAVDGAGNVFIADTGNNQIVEIPVVAGAPSTAAQVAIVASGTSIAGAALSGPQGVSIDPAGNLYIADTGNKRVLFLPGYESYQLSGAYTLGSQWTSPVAIAVAPSGLIYVADSGAGEIDSIVSAISTSTETTVVTGLDAPSSISVDPAGDLFVVEAGSSNVLRIPSISGSLAQSSETNLTDGIGSPYALALDPAGNLYVTDNVNAAAWLIPRTSTTVAFSQTNPGTTANPTTIFVENSGNQPLTLGTPDYTVSGNSAAFTLSDTGEADCTSGASIAVGADCQLQAGFAPTADQSYTATVNFSTNAVNTLAPQITLDGLGGPTVATTTTFSITSPSGNPQYAQPILISATVTSSQGTPSGKVQLLVDGLQAAAATLSSGAAVLSLPTGLGAGTHTLQVAFEGGLTGSTYYAAGLSAVQSITVTHASTTTALVVTTAYVDPASEPVGSPVTLTATIGTASTGIPSGTVRFDVRDSVTGTVEITAPVTAVNGMQVATTTYTPTAVATGQPFDVVVVAAYYSGDTDFQASSTQQSFDVAPAAGSLVLSSSGSTLTSSATSQSAIQFSAVSYGGWQGVVSYQCESSTLPVNAICVFSPGQLLVSASPTGTNYPPTFATKLTVVVDNPPNSPAQGSIVWWIAGIFGAILLVKRRKLARSGVWGAMVLLIGGAISLAALGAMNACGAGGSFLTPTGSSTVTVIAYSDPYVPLSNPQTTQPCGLNSSGTAEPNLAPCAEQTYQVTLTVH